MILLPELGLDNAGWYSAKFTAAEFSNALKPVFLRYLAAFIDEIVYLDSDIAVFDRFSEMIDLLKTNNLILVPHMLSPLPRPDQFYTYPRRVDIFNSGLINAGCFAIRLSKCQDFLTFWEEANFSPGAFFTAAGYQTDQHNLNWALVTVPDATVLRATRYNVAYWNLHDRDFRFQEGDPPIFTVDGKNLASFHFSGYDVRDRLRLSTHDGRYSVYNLPAVAEILNWYSDRILSCFTAQLIDAPYRFDRLSNGFELTKFVREILKGHDVHFPRFDTQTLQGADGLCSFLMDPLPARGSLLPLVAAEIYETRPDLRTAFPGAHAEVPPSPFWRWFCRHAGPEYGIEFLVNRFRRVLMSDSLVDFVLRVTAILGDNQLRFLGADRTEAARQLRRVGATDDEMTLLEARSEWCFVTDLSAAFIIYKNRPDVREAFPDILDRDHRAFCKWLNDFPQSEHAAPPGLGDKLSRCSGTSSLARIFSFLSRHEDVSRICQGSLLLDDPLPLLQCLIRGAGDGLEYDLDDVIVLQYVHETNRYLLVPLYLELPLVRAQTTASRIDPVNRGLLPEAIRDAAWAIRGCSLHASFFDKAEASLDQDMREWYRTTFGQSRHVGGLLQKRMQEADLRHAALVHRVATPQASPAEHSLGSENHPGVNIFGYFFSDIGLGESSRGLTKAVSMLRRVNNIPFCTMQLRDKTALADLFCHFDYSADTNVFVTYPHQKEDLLEMVRPEQVLGRRNVAHLAWEQKAGNRWWKLVYDRYDEIWAISAFAASPFAKMFPGRVRVVPNVLDFESFPMVDPSKRLRNDIIEYLFVFDANSSIERKNPEGVLDAFTRAFAGTRHADRVRLTLKIIGMNRAEHSDPYSSPHA